MEVHNKYVGKALGFSFFIDFSKISSKYTNHKKKGLTKNSFFSSEKFVETKRKNTFD
jgi:hypothetical protein